MRKRKHVKKNTKIKKILKVFVTVVLAAILIALAVFAGIKAFPEVYGRRTFIGSTSYSLKDKHVTDLSDLYILRRLTKLDLRGNDIDEETYHKLINDWPECDITWDAPINGTVMDSSLKTLTFEKIPEDFENVKYFNSLEEVIINRPEDQDEMLALKDSYPQYRFSWSVLMNGEWYAPDTSVIDLKDTPEVYSEIKNMLKYFQHVETVNVEGTGIDVYKQKELIDMFPNIDFNWSVLLWNEVFSENSESVKLTVVKNPDLIEFDTALKVFTSLKTVELSGDGLDTTLQKWFIDTYPNMKFVWEVKLWNEVFDQNADTISLTVNKKPDLEQLDEAIYIFNNLKTINMSGDRLKPALQKELIEKYPDMEFVWDVKVWGESFGQNDETITLTPVKTPDMQEFEDALSVFRSLKSVKVNGTALTPAVQRNLIETHPELKFAFTVVLGTDTFDQDVKSITLSAQSSPTLDDLENALHVFHGLEKIDFTNSGVHGSVRFGLKNNHPELDISWRVFIMGEEIPLDTEKLDYSNMQLSDEDVRSIREGAAQLPELTRVDMHYCGVDDEIMDEMNRENEQVKFVWTIQFANYTMPTDAKYFMPAQFEYGAPLFNSNSYKLRYLTDLECLDLGHSHVEDLSFLQYMPHMKYLILVDSSVLTLEYVSYCKELLFLECFVTYIHDLSPLLECPSLEDLNIGYTRCNPDEAFEVLSKMTWLKRLWYCGTPLSREQVVALREILPDTEQYVRTGGQSTGSTWRYGKNYYDMRDLIGMAYLPGGTIGSTPDGWQEIEDDWGVRFELANWDYRQDWWTQEPFCYYNYHIVGVNCELP